MADKRVASVRFCAGPAALTPVLLTLVIGTVFYPGFMSYDSVHALQAAREGVTESQWPPMVSYIWRLFDALYPDPALMFLVQVLLVLGSVWYASCRLTRSPVGSSALILALLAVPTVFGTLVAIWKDVLMAGLFFASYALLVRADTEESGNRRSIILVAAGGLIAIAVCVRHNALLGALPLLLFLAALAVPKSQPGVWRRAWRVLPLFLLLLTGVLAFKAALDRYSIPELRPLSTGAEYHVRGSRLMDLVGASLCVGENLMSEIGSQLSIEQIRTRYNPAHPNLSEGGFQGVVQGEQIDSQWWRMAVRHPLCIFANRLSLAKIMLGIEPGPQFAITYPDVAPNPWGYQLTPSATRDILVSHIVCRSEAFYFRPWFIYSVTLAVFALTVIARRARQTHIALFVSCVLYWVGLVAFGNAGDARLAFYTTVGSILLLWVLAFDRVTWSALYAQVRARNSRSRPEAEGS